MKITEERTLTAVGADDKASEDHHFEGAAELGQPHQTPADEGEQVVYEHGFPPGKKKKTQTSIFVVIQFSNVTYPHFKSHLISSKIDLFHCRRVQEILDLSSR